MSRLTIAIAKGRLQEESFELVKQGGINVSAGGFNSRKRFIEDEDGQFGFIFVKPADVPVYVEHGVADAGICGSDVLMESAADVHQPLDLGFGRCTLVVAGKSDLVARRYDPLATARVATKYPRITAEYFQQRGVSVELIVLSGSVGLAPVLGLVEAI